MYGEGDRKLKYLVIRQNTNHCKTIYGKDCTDNVDKVCENCEQLYLDESDNIIDELTRCGYEVQDIMENHYEDTPFNLYRDWWVKVTGSKQIQPDLVILN